MQPPPADRIAPKRRIVTPWNLLFFLLGLGLLAALLTQVSFPDLLRQLAGIPSRYLLLGGLAYLLKTGLRALRFMRLNRAARPGFFDMLRLVLASSLASQLLPLKLGEFAYLYLLKRGSRASIPQGLSSLLAARLFDLLAVALLFVLVSLALGLPGPAQLSTYLTAILVFIALLSAAILGLLLASRLAGRLLERFFALPIARRLPLREKLRAGLGDLFAALAAYTPRETLEWAALAGLEWFVNYYAFQILLLGLGLDASFYATVVAVTFAALASVLPLNSFGSFGTQEAGWDAGLLLMGFTRDSAIASGFATHLLTLAYILVLGGLSWLSYLLPTRAGSSQT